MLAAPSAVQQERESLETLKVDRKEYSKVCDRTALARSVQMCAVLKASSRRRRRTGCGGAQGHGQGRCGRVPRVCPPRPQGGPAHRPPRGRARQGRAVAKRTPAGRTARPPPPPKPAPLSPHRSGSTGRERSGHPPQANPPGLAGRDHGRRPGARPQRHQAPPDRPGPSRRARAPYVAGRIALGIAMGLTRVARGGAGRGAAR